MRKATSLKFLLGLATVMLAGFPAVGEEATAMSCCSKPADGATALSCSSSGEHATGAADAADAHADHGAAATAPDAHAGHGAQAEAAAPQAGGHAGMSCCSKDGMGELAGQGHMGRGGMGRGGMGAVMPDAMRLLHNYASLERKVEEIPNGVRTVTTAKDPGTVELLRRHARGMYGFYESGGVVRPHDPMFRELSKVADRVTMEFKDIENGLEVTTTSEDAEVVKLIRAHAYKVSEFVKRGMSALHEGAPLPEDYHPTN